MIVQEAIPITHVVTKIGAILVGVQEAGEPSPGQRGFLAGRIPAIASQRHSEDPMSLDRGDALPSGIAIQVRGHRDVEIAEQNDLRIPDQNLLDRHRAAGAGDGGNVGAAGELDVEIVIGARAAHAQGVRVARKIERARPLPWLQARGRRLDLGQALLLALDELARSRVLARDLSHHRHVGIGIALGAGANAEHLEADAIESLDRIAADGRLKDDVGFQGEDRFDVRREPRAVGDVGGDAEHLGKYA